jgi:hypothetical protein
MEVGGSGNAAPIPLRRFGSATQGEHDMRQTTRTRFTRSPAPQFFTWNQVNEGRLPAGIHFGWGRHHVPPAQSRCG